MAAPVCFTAPGLPAAIVSTTNDATKIAWTFTNFEPENDAEVEIFVGRHCGSVSLSEKDQNGPGIVIAKRVYLKTEPSINASAIKKRAKVNEGTSFDVYNSSGEWWYVKLNDGTEGWLRWREVDADTGEERIYAAFAYYLAE